MKKQTCHQLKKILCPMIEEYAEKGVHSQSELEELHTSLCCLKDILKIEYMEKELGECCEDEPQISNSFILGLKSLASNATPREKEIIENFMKTM